MRIYDIDLYILNVQNYFLKASQSDEEVNDYSKKNNRKKLQKKHFFNGQKIRFD